MLLFERSAEPAAAAAAPSDERRARSDGELLRLYVEKRDERAFAELVRRYAGLVYGVARRVLSDADAADDAFQATFLVLVRRASSLDLQGSLGGWLFGVARRTALKAKGRAARQREREKQVPAMTSEQDVHDEAAWQEIKPILDEELSRLPTKYRLPLVLCYLQGKTHQEAAQELGWPSGSMSRRMARGRELLRERLEGRGVALPGVALFGLLLKHGGNLIPTALLEPTIQGALAFGSGVAAAGISLTASVIDLANHVLNRMRVGRRKFGCLTLLVIMSLVTGGGVVLGASGVPLPRLWPWRTQCHMPAAVAAPAESAKEPAGK